MTRALSKPDLGGVSHPARFSDALFPHFVESLGKAAVVLDPFAGTGKIHRLRDFGFYTIGVEIEPEWARLHPGTMVGNALHLPLRDRAVDAICTSPCYGNRLADHHRASDPGSRRSYTHDLGRSLHDDNAGAMHWGPAYRAFHAQAWAEAVRVLCPWGVFVLNIKDHYRAGRWQDVAGWHLAVLVDLGLEPFAVRPVTTTALRSGANGKLRTDAELVMGFTKVEPT